MKKKVLAFLCMLTVLVGTLAFVAPASASAAENDTYLVGYSKTSIDPIDVAGTYRKVDLTSKISEATKAGKFSSLSYLTLAEGDVYTVADYSDTVGVSAAVPDGYFQVPLGGYAGQESRISEGRMDDSGNGSIGDEDGMRATAIVITDSTGNTLALVGIDAISADADVVKNAKTKIHNATGIPRSNIMINASHTHSGVYTGLFSTTYDTEEEAKSDDAVARAAKVAAQLAYKSLAADRIAQAVINAYNNKAEATISKASLEIADNMNFVRHYRVQKTAGWFGSADDYVTGDNFGGGTETGGNFLTGTYTTTNVSDANNTMEVLQIQYTGGTGNKVLLANWRAHPKCNSTASSTYGSNHRSYSSSDYVGAFRVAMESAGYDVAFFQGAAGNINTYSSISSKTNSATVGSGGQEGGLYGKQLKAYTVNALNSASFQVVSAGEINVKDRLFTGNPITYSAKEVAAAKEWKTKYDAGTYTGTGKYTASNGVIFNSYYHVNTVYGRVKDTKAGEAFTTNGGNLVLGAITVGSDLAFVTSPNELYDRYSASATLNNTSDNDWDDLNGLGYGTPFVLAYTNNSGGYLPNTLAYNYNAGSSKYGQGSYEANTSAYAAGDGERVIANYKTMLETMSTEDAAVEGTCKTCGAVTWRPLTGIYDDTVINAGHYYLTEDLANELNYQKQIGEKVCIDLNGHTYANQSGVTGRAFVVNAGGVLTIQDSVGGGKVQGQGHSTTIDGGVITVANGGTLNLYDATIERVRTTQKAQYGGAVNVAKGGTFNMYSGTVTGGLSEGTNGYGGNIFCAGTFNMSGGTVTGGEAEQKGQNVYVTPDGTFAMSGGTITGGVHVKAANKNVSLSGSAVIYDANAESNLFLDNDGSNELKACNLTAGAKIGIAAVRYVTTQANYDYFVADEGTYLMKLNGKVFAGDRYSCECGGKAEGKYGHTCEPIVWAPWPGTVTPPNGAGNYYLKYDCKPTGAASVTGTLRIDLNGKSIDRQVSKSDASAVYALSSANAKLTITDTVGGGVIKRTLSDETIAANHAGTCITMTGSNTLFRLYAGTIDGQGQKTTSGGGGVIAGNNADGTPAVEIYGGTVKGAVANYGGCIYAKGPVLLAGGTIQGGTVNQTGGGVFVDTMGSLILTGDATVTGNTTASGVVNNIYCPANKLTVTGTYTGTAGIVVSSPTMGKVVGVSNNANISGATLTVDNEDLYEIVTSGTQLKLTASSNMAVKQTNGNDVAYYESMEAALQDYAGGNAYLTLLQEVEAVTLTVPTKIDLAGHNISAVTLTGTGSLQIVDSATDDFTVEDADGYGTVPASANVTVGEGYILIPEGDRVSAHRLDLTLTEISLRPREAGFYYRSQFGGDEVLKEHISAFGLSLRANSAPDEAYIKADTENKTHCQFDGSAWTTGKTGKSTNSVILQGIMKEENGYLINKRNGDVPVYGVSYVILDGQMILGQDVNYTLHQFFEAANAQFAEFDETDQNSLRNMYETYEQAMRTWSIDNIAAKSFAGKSVTFVGDSITYGATLGADDLRYWEHLRSGLKLGSITNMGVSGSCISSNNDRGHDYQPLMDRYKNIPGSDLIFIFMGTNDFGHNTMISTSDYNATYHKESATRTLAVDLNTVIDYLQTKYPDSEIVLVTPIVRYTSAKNSIGRTLQDYVDAVKAVGQAQGIQVADIYTATAAQMPLETHFNTDKVHPNALGHEVLGSILQAWLTEHRENIFN